jgi:hypothetical protein
LFPIGDGAPVPVVVGRSMYVVASPFSLPSFVVCAAL